MRIVLQKVLWARVEVDDVVVGEIGPGLVSFSRDFKRGYLRRCEYMANKILI